MADYITKGSFNLGNQITLKNKNSNIDRDYGPYENKTLEEIAEELKDTLQIGKTIGVIESGKVVEYWWQPNEELGGKDVLIFYDVRSGKTVSYNYIGEREDIYDTPLYEWGNDSGVKVYTKTKNSTPADNEVYNLIDGAIYFISSVGKIVHVYTHFFVKKGEGSKIVVDGALIATSTNPIQNQAVAKALNYKADSSTVRGIGTRVGTLETTITSKAEQSEVEALQAAVGENTTAIAGKQDKITVETIRGDILGEMYFGVEPNIIYDIYALCSNNTTVVELEFEGNPNESGQHYMTRLHFQDDATDISVNMSSAITWYGGNEPEWQAGKTYEISIIDGLALWAEF